MRTQIFHVPRCCLKLQEHRKSLHSKFDKNINGEVMPQSYFFQPILIIQITSLFDGTSHKIQNNFITHLVMMIPSHTFFPMLLCILFTNNFNLGTINLSIIFTVYLCFQWRWFNCFWIKYQLIVSTKFTECYTNTLKQRHQHIWKSI